MKYIQELINNYNNVLFESTDPNCSGIGTLIVEKYENNDKIKIIKIIYIFLEVKILKLITLKVKLMS